MSDLDKQLDNILSIYGTERAKAWKATGMSHAEQNLYSKVAEGLKANAKAALRKLIIKKQVEARLVELDLLEQAINGDYDLYDFKMKRLAALQKEVV